MRPMNSKQRRTQFLLFVVLFATAMVPVVGLVYANGRLEDVELAELRERVRQKEGTDLEVKSDLKRVGGAKDQVAGLKDYLVNNSAALRGLAQNHSGSIDGKLTDVTSAVSAVYDLTRKDPTDSLFYIMVQDLSECVKQLNKVYLDGLEVKKEYDKLQKDYDKCLNATSPFGGG